MSQGPIKEPVGVDLFVDGRALTATETVHLKAFIQKNRMMAKRMERELETLRKRLLERPTPTWTQVLEAKEARRPMNEGVGQKRQDEDLDVDSRVVTSDDLKKISKQLLARKTRTKRPSSSLVSKATGKGQVQRRKSGKVKSDT